MHGRVRIAQRYTAHLRQSAQLDTAPDTLYWPIWHPRAFPRVKEHA
jgi:hypothetical protein